MIISLFGIETENTISTWGRPMFSIQFTVIYWKKHGLKSVKIERKQQNKNIWDIDQLQLRVQVF